MLDVLTIIYIIILIIFNYLYIDYYTYYFNSKERQVLFERPDRRSTYSNWSQKQQINS